MAKPKSATDSALFVELATRYGGIASLSLADAAVVRALATELSKDTIDPKVVTDLHGLLPKSDAGEPWNLALLADSQLNALEKLSAIAHGKKPAVPEHRRKSTKHWLALQVAALLDRAAIRPLDANETIELKSNIELMLSPLLIADLWRATFAPIVPLAAETFPAIEASPIDQTAPAAAPVAPAALGNILDFTPLSQRKPGVHYDH